MAGLIIELGKPKKGSAPDDEPDGDESDMDVSDDQKLAGQDFADAVKSGDGEAIVLAFKQLQQACKGY